MRAWRRGTLHSTRGNGSSQEPLSEAIEHINGVIGALRSYINDVAYTTANLEALMRRHPREFIDIAKDPVAAMAHLDENLTLMWQDNEFLEERGPNDPPRDMDALEVRQDPANPELIQVKYESFVQLRPDKVVKK